MAQTRDYATKKKGKTEVQPFWNMSDIKNVVEWFEKNNERSEEHSLNSSHTLASRMPSSA